MQDIILKEEVSAISRPSCWRGLAEGVILGGSFGGEEPLCSCISLTFLPSYAFKLMHLYTKPKTAPKINIERRKTLKAEAAQTRALTR
ncbi:hypothetical protein [Sutterella wadsworthensis]|jgi:hypothetical protein|uniref:hypothetical protein n=1 Tax=Sutterella wadsworthensis TaxID=40545 RepID=UPI001D08313F|nr:hypothetical protein [Sutterella wadsworthensis]MCB7457340.1 hypothetical protein [Sutterella wadsworthensis]